MRIALHPQRIDTDARQCFAEVDAGLCDYLGLDARLLAPGPLTRNLRQRKSIEYLNRLLVAQDIQMLCLNVDNEELHQQANALPFAFRHGRHYSELSRPGRSAVRPAERRCGCQPSRQAGPLSRQALPLAVSTDRDDGHGQLFREPLQGQAALGTGQQPKHSGGALQLLLGYYHGHSFDDCARYLMPDRDDVDKLVIGSFCSIGSGAAFIMAGNQGHRAEWASTFPFHFMHEEPAFAGAVNGYQPAGDTLIGHEVWIEAMFMPAFGHGAIIGSRALVTGELPRQ